MPEAEKAAPGVDVAANANDGCSCAPAAENQAPPVNKYELTLTIYGNSHEEIEQELGYFVRGGYLLASGYHKRDEFKVIGGRRTAELVHANPDQTPERFNAELSAWADGHKEARRA